MNPILLVGPLVGHAEFLHSVNIQPMRPCLVLKEAFFMLVLTTLISDEFNHVWWSYGQNTYLRAGYLGRRRKYELE